MSEADQENTSKQEAGRGAPGSGAASPQPAGEGDASFARLLAQLKAEEDRPAAAPGVSQIFLPDGDARARQRAAVDSLPLVDAQAFAPRTADGSAFSPGPPALNFASGDGFDRQAAGVVSNERTPLSRSEGATAARLAETSRTPEALASATQTTPVKPAAPETAGEFTRIFTQLPTPRSAPPAILAEVSAQPAETAAPGEFTQFFQALAPASASRSSMDGPTPANAPRIASGQLRDPDSLAARTPPMAPSATPAAGEALRSREPEIAENFQPATQVPNPSAAQAFHPSQSADPGFAPAAFAPKMSAQTSAPAAFAPAPSASASQVAKPSTQPGAFTGFFKPAAPAAPERIDPWESFSGSSASAGSAMQQPTFPASFSEPARSQPSAGGGFTELLHSLGTEPGPSPTNNRAPSPPAVSSPGPLSAQAFAPRVAEFHPALAPQSSLPPRPPAAAGRPGEFTELMQSLQAPQASAPSAPAPAPFFVGSAPVSSAGPSEFTRILQGSAARSADLPVATFAPAQQSSGAAVGLPIAAPQMPRPATPQLPTAEAKTRLQAMMPWLLAANGALLLLLIALAFLFLRHHR